MNKNRLASVSALTLSLLATSVQAATYQVVELASNSKGLNNFGQSINENGDTLSYVQASFNPKIDVSLLDLTDNPTLTDSLSDLDGVRNGNINSEDLVIIYNYLRARNTDNISQKIGSYASYLTSGNDVTQVAGNDVIVPELDNSLSNSVNTFAFHVNAQGNYVGSGMGPTRKLAYTNNEDTDITYVVRDFWHRGFVNVNGVTIPVLPKELKLGGMSEAKDINDSNLIAGSQSVDLSSGTNTAEANCRNDEQRGDVPVDVCLNTAARGANLASFTTDVTPSSGRGAAISLNQRATLWQLGDDNQLTEVKVFGLLDTPETSHEDLFFSRAKAVNNQGIAVGEANDYFDDNRNSNFIRTFAAVFQGDEVTSFTDQKEYFNSTANDINDNNLIVGHANKNINGFNRSKFYVHDLNTNQTTYPTDFFPGSSSTARGINNQGQVVGDGEVDSALNQNRRRHGFLYNVSNSTFQDLNTLLSCDNRYTIVQGNDINDKGEILATAVINKPRLDITGQVVKDSDGNEQTLDVTVAVKLVPTGGEIEDCSAQQPKVERKGGAIALLSLLLLPLIRLRRK